MGSSVGESFVLRWSEFQTNLISCLSELRYAEDFFDVTLSIDEEHQIQAHKVILAASSSYFKALLKRNPTGHPVLVMPPEVKFAELASILDFMYHGEVTVPNEELENLLKLANILKVKGLVDESTSPPGPTDQQKPSRNQIKKSGGAAKRRVQEDFPMPPQQAQAMPTSKKRRHTNKKPAGGFMTPGYSGSEGDHQAPNQDYHPGADFGQQNILVQGAQQQPKSQTSSSPSQAPKFVALQCPQCPKRLPSVESFREHMGVVHGRGQVKKMNDENSHSSETSQSLSCNICDKVFKAQKYLSAHVKRLHKVDSENSRNQMMSPSGSSGGNLVKRGRPPKNSMNEEEMDDYDSLSHQNVPEAKAINVPRPIGQVQPAPRASIPSSSDSSGEHGSSANAGESGEPRPGPSTSNMNSQSMPRGPQRMPQAKSGVSQYPMQHGKGTFASQDLRKKLGLKFGGQISITSGDQEAQGRSSGSGSVSITKMKSDSPVAKMPFQSQHPVQVKEEPFDEDEDEQERENGEDQDPLGHEEGEEDDFEEGQFDEFGDEDFSDYPGYEDDPEGFEEVIDD